MAYNSIITPLKETKMKYYVYRYSADPGDVDIVKINLTIVEAETLLEKLKKDDPHGNYFMSKQNF